jgi:membrane protein
VTSLDAGRGGPLRQRLAAVAQAVDAGRHWFDGSILGRWWAELLALTFVDRAVALAAKAFVAFLPAVLTLATLAPEDVQQSIAASMQRRLGLSGRSLDLVQSTLASRQPVDQSTGVLSFLLLLFYATTFTTALQRVYLSTWRRPTSRDRVREVKGLAWLFGIIALLAVFGSLSRALTGLLGEGFVVVLAFGGTVGLWWTTSFMMLRRQVRWRVLLPPAVVLAAGSLLYTISAAVWVPRSMVANQEQFGFFGVSMTLVSWFVGYGFLVVGAAAVGPVLATDQGRIGRLVRGPEDSLLRPGASPPVGDVGQARPQWLFPGPANARGAGEAEPGISDDD